MIFVPVVIVVLFAIVFTPASGGRRKKSKGVFGSLLDGQRETEKRNNSHRGVMCPPGGSKRRK